MQAVAACGPVLVARDVLHSLQTPLTSHIVPVLHIVRLGPMHPCPTSTPVDKKDSIIGAKIIHSTQEPNTGKVPKNTVLLTPSLP